MSAVSYRLEVRDRCAAAGVQIIPKGVGFLLVGDGLYLLVADLAHVRLEDLPN